MFVQSTSYVLFPANTNAKQHLQIAAPVPYNRFQQLP